MIFVILLFKYFFAWNFGGGRLKFPKVPQLHCPCMWYQISYIKYNRCCQKQTHPVGTPTLKFDSQGVEDVEKGC